MIKTGIMLALALLLCAPVTGASHAKSKGKAGSSELGVVDIVVVDEDDKIVPNVRLSIDGKEIQSPFSHKAGKIKVKATSEVGEATSDITVKADEITRVSLKFFGLRETVTRVVPVLVERYHGTIIFLNCLGSDTDVFVDRKDGQIPDAIDGRISKGSGSMKISNLVIGTYNLEVKRKDGKAVQECANGCKADVLLKKGETVKVKADSEGVQSSTRPLACRPMQDHAAAKK